MWLKNTLQNTSLLALFFLLCSIRQVIAEVDVPELQFLASHLKPEECVKLVSYDPHPPLSKAQIKNLAEEQDCFQGLVKWICRVKAVTSSTKLILQDRLQIIGRQDLISCLAVSGTKSSQSSKKIREARSSDDTDDYDTGAPLVSNATVKNATKSNSTILKHDGRKDMKISLKTAGIILAVCILLSCICALFIRSKFSNLFSSLRRKKKKNKFTPIGSKDGKERSRRNFPKRSHKKRKRAPSYDIVHTATQNGTNPEAPKESGEVSPTGCAKCCRKKRKRSEKKPKR